jgi:hypothetical protein
MSPEVEHSERVKEFLRTHPGAEEVRLAIACIARGQPPKEAVLALDPADMSYAILEDSQRCLWWYWRGSRLVVDDITEPP